MKTFKQLRNELNESDYNRHEKIDSIKPTLEKHGYDLHKITNKNKFGERHNFTKTHPKTGDKHYVSVDQKTGHWTSHTNATDSNRSHLVQHQDSLKTGEGKSKEELDKHLTHWHHEHPLIKKVKSSFAKMMKRKYKPHSGYGGPSDSSTYYDGSSASNGYWGGGSSGGD
jgi:hypothetical protein